MRKKVDCKIVITLTHNGSYIVENNGVTTCHYTFKDMVEERLKKSINNRWCALLNYVDGAKFKEEDGELLDEV
jgi:hypothetical protein